MQLFEFFNELDQRYNNENDHTVYDIAGDTRKSKLTLQMINGLRETMQKRREEQRQDRELYQKMYGGSITDTAEPTL
jgi:hypothetical protein